MQVGVLWSVPAGSTSTEVRVMNETIFLAIAVSAAVFKAVAIVIGVVWAFRSLLTQQAAPAVYRHTRVDLPYLSGNARRYMR
jgi:hypothetical protein